MIEITKKLTLLFILFFISQSYASDKAVSVQTIVKTTKSWNGDTLPHYPKGQPEISILKITIPAGVEIPWHEHPVINAGILTKGSLKVVTKDGKTLNMVAGNPITEVVNTWHYGVNTSKEEVEIIVFYAGIENQPITIKQP
jgi:quercetin dioxygenase-like cupin family protein